MAKRVPVLLAVPRVPSLVESALTFFRSTLASVPYVGIKLPDFVDLVANAPPIPYLQGQLQEGVEDVLQQVQEFLLSAWVTIEDDAPVPQAIEGGRVFANPRIQPDIVCSSSPPEGNLTHIRAKLKVDDLHRAALDGSRVAVALMDGGINLARIRAKLPGTRLDVENSWNPAIFNIPTGQYNSDHAFMCAFDALLAAPKATLVDCPILFNDTALRPQTRVENAMAAFAHLVFRWAVSTRPDSLRRRYEALVVSNSWGLSHPEEDFEVGHPGRYIDNPAHPLAMLVRSMADAGADVVFSAGNCGAECPRAHCGGRTGESIMGANASADVLTFAACDRNDARLGYSSTGPAILGLKREKPDLAAYAHFEGSGGLGTKDDGTSAACAVGAGCVAALRSKLKPAALPPPRLFDILRETARRRVGVTGWKADLGFGIIDPVAAVTKAGVSIPSPLPAPVPIS